MVKRIITHPLFVGAIGALVARFLADGVEKYGWIIVKFLYSYLWTGIWPIWIGLIVAGIYWLIRFLVGFYKMVKASPKFFKRVEELEAELTQNIEPRINELEKPAQLEVLRKAILKEK